jgi:hypothetical protein
MQVLVRVLDALVIYLYHIDAMLSEDTTGSRHGVRSEE